MKEFQIPGSEAPLHWPCGIKSQSPHKPPLERRFPSHQHMTYKHLKHLILGNAYSHLLHYAPFGIVLEGSQSSISLPHLQMRKLRLRQWGSPNQSQDRAQKSKAFSLIGHVFKIVGHKWGLSRNPWSQGISKADVPQSGIQARCFCQHVFQGQTTTQTHKCSKLAFLKISHENHKELEIKKNKP